MKPDERVERWLTDLDATLATAADLVTRGRGAFDVDPAVPLAFEALSNRIGDLAKRLLAVDPEHFGDPIWRQAARQRDFVVHHYDRMDADLLWQTVTHSFPKLADAVRASRGGRVSGR